MRGLLSRFVLIHDHEVAPALYSFAAMFCLLASYFVVVPLREEAGISLGTDTLPKLFTASLFGVLLVAPLTSALLSRTGQPQERLLRQLYVILGAVMLAFYLLYYSSVLHAHNRPDLAAGSSSSSSSSGGSSSSGSSSSSSSSSGGSSSSGSSSSSSSSSSSGGSSSSGSSSSSSGIETPAVEQAHGQPGMQWLGLAALAKPKGSSGPLLPWPPSPSPLPSAVATNSAPAQTSALRTHPITTAEYAKAQLDSLGTTTQLPATAQPPQPTHEAAADRVLPDLGAQPSSVFGRTGKTVPASGLEPGSLGRLLGGVAGEQPLQARHGETHRQGLNADRRGQAARRLQRQQEQLQHKGEQQGKQQQQGTEQQQQQQQQQGTEEQQQQQQQGLEQQLEQGGAGPQSGPSAKHGDPSLDSFQRALRVSFFVWLNVQNLVAMSSMWARCADVFAAEAARRLFGFIAAGATLGQLAGSLTSMAITSGLGRHHLTLSSLIFISSMLIFATSWLSARVNSPSPRALSSAAPGAVPATSAVTHRGGSVGEGEGGVGPAGGEGGGAGGRKAGAGVKPRQGPMAKVLEGWMLIATSPYLLLLCAYLLATYAVGSLMYFQRSLLVAQMVEGASNRAAFFARINSISAALIFILQLLATGRLLGWLGITASLSLYPVTCLASIILLTSLPGAAVMSGVEVSRKLLGYSLVRPAREVLFTVLTRDEKYKAKLAIDAVVQRMGDTLAAACFEVLDVRLNLGVTGVAWAGSVACLGWLFVSLSLGWQYQRMARSQPPLPPR